MIKYLLLITAFIVYPVAQFSAQTCSPAGNVIIFANYDGGVLNINCDQNIANLKIGVCTYENVEINISGAFAGNVTEIIYAGFEGDNDNCNQGVNSTTISGVPGGITSILFAPPGVLTDPDGYPSIICAYACGPGNQGGCNTSAQVVAYFMNEFGGTLRTYNTQYACWQGETYNASVSNCCSIPTPQLEAFFTVSDPIACVGQCITFNDLSSQDPTDWTWTFEGANVTTSNQQNPGSICFLEAGIQQVSLLSSNDDGNDSYIGFVEVIACGTPGCTYPNATNYNAAATIDDGSCFYPICTNSCPGDFNEDGLISVSDLIVFIALYGSVCPD